MTISEKGVRGSAEQCGSLITAIISAGLGILLWVGVSSGVLARLDEYFFSLSRGDISPDLFSILKFLNLISSPSLIIAIIAVGSLLLIRFHRREAMTLFVVTAATYVSLFLFKEFLSRARPPEPLVYVSGGSFPSGHAASIFLIALFAFYAARTLKVRGWWFWFIAVAGSLSVIGAAFSRILLRAHWFSDVVGGLLLSLFWFSIICFFSSRYFRLGQ